MSRVTHLSMRVPWRDRAWDERVCDHPLDNSSCILLANIGDKRDDNYEVGIVGQPFAEHDMGRLPCLSERATFMSPTGYSVTKHHPYEKNRTLKDHLRPSVVSVPGFAFEAIPFRWLNRTSFYDNIWPTWQLDFDDGAEAAADDVLGFKPAWIMDGENQKSVISNFFDPVVPGESLVFIYVKYSPFQEESPRRLLVGAARVTDVQAPPMWNHEGVPPFESSMWETIVCHSLRSDMADGILLPYQELVALMDQGRDIEAGLAWAPENRIQEFSYVTEHVSDDAAIEALLSLQRAAEGCRSLGLSVNESATEWVESQIEHMWELRGPTPGLGSVLAFLGVKGGHKVARLLLASPVFLVDPWGALNELLSSNRPWPSDVAASVPGSVSASWNASDLNERAALRVLSTMDVTADQVRLVMLGETTVGLTHDELVVNPYFASTCTYQLPLHVPFATVDRAVYPSPLADWSSALPNESRSDDPNDARRVEALLTDVLESLADQGHTLASQDQAIRLASERQLAQDCTITPQLLRGHGLDASSLDDREDWSPLCGAETAGGVPALKLARLEETKCAIVEEIDERRKGARFNANFDARERIDLALANPSDGTQQEESARTEKAFALAELFAARLSVLVGPAGTGKTTLLKALVDLPEVRDRGVVLLAPTGKAAVQLEGKVGHKAQTLASYLIRQGGYDSETGVYCSDIRMPHQTNAGLVVIDEASMLTEEMLAATLATLGSVDRVVLVGDPRQLPPIGAGRPFVDLVAWSTPDTFPVGSRVGPGYVELTVLRRQDGRDRDDLLLARWFGGGDLSVDADEVWQRLRAGEDMPTLCAVEWTEAGVSATVMDALDNELDFSASSDPENAFKLTYGGALSPDGKWVNWDVGSGGAGELCEQWQILSPTRSRSFGTVEINRHIKRTFRSNDLAAAQRHRGWRSSAPIGPEQIVRGDKVMQTQNERKKAYPSGSGLGYVANGDIGVVVGSFTNRPKALPANVEFASQPGARYSYWPSQAADAPLELAWAVTVHKSQGSEFGTTILVLPRRARVSRELMYTALTRQTKRIVILHEGTIDEIRAIASPSNSETASRITDLFRTPQPRDITVGGEARKFDANLIHIASNNVVVRSKNEVIIANILENLAPGRWKYEDPVIGKDGTKRLPDFKIERASGEKIFWEHLGMLDDPQYSAAWERKKRWYAANGILPHDDAQADRSIGVLIWTDDRAGVDQPGWQRLAEKVIGKVARRPTAKKSVAKK